MAAPPPPAPPELSPASSLPAASPQIVLSQVSTAFPRPTPLLPQAAGPSCTLRGGALGSAPAARHRVSKSRLLEVEQGHRPTLRFRRRPCPARGLRGRCSLPAEPSVGLRRPGPAGSVLCWRRLESCACTTRLCSCAPPPSGRGCCPAEALEQPPATLCAPKVGWLAPPDCAPDSCPSPRAQMSSRQPSRRGPWLCSPLQRSSGLRGCGAVGAHGTHGSSAALLGWEPFLGQGLLPHRKTSGATHARSQNPSRMRPPTDPPCIPLARSRPLPPTAARGLGPGDPGP